MGSIIAAYHLNSMCPTLNLKPYHFASTPSPPPQMPTKQHNQKQGQKKEPRFLSLHDCHLLNRRSLTFAWRSSISSRNKVTKDRSLRVKPWYDPRIHPVTLPIGLSNGWMDDIRLYLNANSTYANYPMSINFPWIKDTTNDTHTSTTVS